MEMKDRLLQILMKEELGEFDNFLDPKTSERKSENTPEISTIDKQAENQRLWDILNPLTGKRFEIPMLDQSAGSFYWDYIYYMKLRERDPKAFEKIMDWN